MFHIRQSMYFSSVYFPCRMCSFILSIKHSLLPCRLRISTIPRVAAGIFPKLIRVHQMNVSETCNDDSEPNKTLR